MINLMLTGRAAANVFNGDIEFNKRGRKLVRGRELYRIGCCLVIVCFVPELIIWLVVIKQLEYRNLPF